MPLTGEAADATNNIIIAYDRIQFVSDRRILLLYGEGEVNSDALASPVLVSIDANVHRKYKITNQHATHAGDPGIAPNGVNPRNTTDALHAHIRVLATGGRDDGAYISSPLLARS